MKNKVIATLVALTMLGQVTLTVNANTIDTSTGTGDSSAILSQEQTSFNVTVPTSLPVAVDRDGVVTTATDVEIRNNSYGPIVISDIQVDVANGWSLVDFNKDMSKSLVGLKEFGFIIQGDEVQSTGDVGLTPASWESIPGNGSMQLTYDATVSPQKTALSDVNIANVVFILGWDETEYTSKYTLATDDDFVRKSADSREYFQYIGTDDYVEIPHVIRGQNVDSYYLMFQGTSVKGVKSTNTNVTDIESMFNGCSNLTTLDLSSFDTSNVTNMRNMFSGCSNLTTLDLSRFDTSNVTDMGYMFFKCSSLTTLDLSSFNTSNVTDMWGVFQACSSLTTLDLSSFDTSNVTKMADMFSGCSNLTTLDLSNFDTSNVINIGSMFFNCSSLTTLDLSNFDISNVTYMNYMVYGCQNLTTLDLSSFDTSNVTKMTSMFYKCTSLQLVYVKTEADASRFKLTSDGLGGLTFIVK